MSAKQKIVHGHGLSNLNLGIFVCSFDVCRASKSFPSINYDTTQLHPFYFWVTRATGNPVYAHGASSSALFLTNELVEYSVC